MKLDKKIRKYVNSVLRNINASAKLKRRIREDLTLIIQEKMENGLTENVRDVMGDPRQVAEEFMEGLDLDEQTNMFGSMRGYYEFKSKQTIFGIPLVHINLSGNRSTRIARGIVAIGDGAIGVITFGGFSLGVISIGGMSIGGVALGGLAIGGVALGGAAIGLITLGGLSLGILKAMGALTSLV